MSITRSLLLVLLLLQAVAGVAWAQAPSRMPAGSPPIDSVRVSFGPLGKTVFVAGYVLDEASRPPVPNLGWPDPQFAFLIRDSTARQPHELRTVTFRIGRGGFPREPFRLRIYQYNDDPDAPPGKDLLTEHFNISSAKEGEFT